MLFFGPIQKRVTESLRKRRGPRNVACGRIALEVLEERTVPSAATTLLGVPLDSAPAPPDVALPPLVNVPVSASAQVSTALAQLLGGQPSLSMYIPVPQFLTPSGTSTVNTALAGPVTFTNFQVNSAQLNQLANSTVLPDGGSPYVSPYMQGASVQTSPTLDVVQFAIEPLTLDLLGVNVAMSGVDMTMSFPDVPGSSWFTGTSGTSPISVVSRGLDLFAWGLGVAQQKVNGFVGNAELPGPLSAVARDLTPTTSGTVPVTQYQVAPTEIDGQTLSVSIAQGTSVDVTATTGAGQLFGNLLADAVSLEATGLETWDALRDKLLSDLLARSPLQMLEEIFSNIPLGDIVPDPSLILDELGTLIAPSLMSGSLTTVVNQSNTALSGSGGMLGGVLNLFSRNNFTTYDGGGTSSGAAGGDRIHLESDAEPDDPQEEASEEWDENPLPQVLPEIGPSDSGGLSQSAGPRDADRSAGRTGSDDPSTLLAQQFQRDAVLWTTALFQTATMMDVGASDGTYVTVESAAGSEAAVLSPSETIDACSVPSKSEATVPPAAPVAMATLALLAIYERRLRDEFKMHEASEFGPGQDAQESQSEE